MYPSSFSITAGRQKHQLFSKMLVISLRTASPRAEFRAQEPCENRDGHPGLPVPDTPYDLCGRKATVNLNTRQTELRSCVKVEVAVLGCSSLIVLTVSVNVKQHWTKPVVLFRQVAVRPSHGGVNILPDCFFPNVAFHVKISSICS